ncbi:mitochondrial fission process protein 1 isoform X3 [Carettochelys insculpta]|uniref:mitochondrial fission process protein 1 isoform X3 n=1 Tax=Carettochelys insculpta TaxID=44489 RepID=UPI003EBB32B3
MGPPAETDLYRDTWVRYLGYANEVGESFRALVPVSLVWASYGVATTYVTADAIDKGKKAAAVCGFPAGLQPPQTLLCSRGPPIILLRLQAAPYGHQHQTPYLTPRVVEPFSASLLGHGAGSSYPTHMLEAQCPGSMGRSR